MFECFLKIDKLISWLLFNIGFKDIDFRGVNFLDFDEITDIASFLDEIGM
jgi:hypothetical protein